jgi:hypothetical protein
MFPTLRWLKPWWRGFILNWRDQTKARFDLVVSPALPGLDNVTLRKLARTIIVLGPVVNGQSGAGSIGAMAGTPWHGCAYLAIDTARGAPNSAGCSPTSSWRRAPIRRSAWWPISLAGPAAIALTMIVTGATMPSWGPRLGVPEWLTSWER